MTEEVDLEKIKPPSGPGLGWKDWVIGALWVATLALAGAGYSSIKDSISKVNDCQAAQTQAFSAFQLENEKRWSTIWRVVDKICGYQSDQMRKDGKTPDYRIQDRP